LLSAERLPDQRWRGSYVLLMRFDALLALTYGGREGQLQVGWFAYVGSARGPGGVGARVARHFSATKKPHWHVDALTLAAARIEAMALRDASECDLGARLCATGRFGYVLSGFGSSDCRSCESHLVRWNGPA
jgi:Uri superfamily endonuclease